MNELPREPKETYQAYKGRLRRLRFDAVDALKLQPGEWVEWNSRTKRFDPGTMTRRWTDYLHMRRATTEEIAEAEKRERERREQEAEARKEKEARERFEALPHIIAANHVRNSLDWDFNYALPQLTPEEWIALGERFRDRE